MTYAIYKFVVDAAGNEGWELHGSFFGSFEDLQNELDSLRLDGSTYRAEDKTDYGSVILGV